MSARLSWTSFLKILIYLAASSCSSFSMQAKLSRGMWDLSFPIRDRTHVPWVARQTSPLDHEGSPSLGLLAIRFFSAKNTGTPCLPNSYMSSQLQFKVYLLLKSLLWNPWPRGSFSVFTTHTFVIFLIMLNKYGVLSIVNSFKSVPAWWPQYLAYRLEIVGQQAPTFLAPGTGFMEGKSSIEWG